MSIYSEINVFLFKNINIWINKSIKQNIFKFAHNKLIAMVHLYTSYKTMFSFNFWDYVFLNYSTNVLLVYNLYNLMQSFFPTLSANLKEQGHMHKQYTNCYLNYKYLPKSRIQLPSKWFWIDLNLKYKYFKHVYFLIFNSYFIYKITLSKTL